MNILGISDVTGNHSHSSVAVLQDKKLTFALSQERLSRIKNDCRFPAEAIQTALDFTGLDLQHIDCFCCGYPPARYYAGLLSRSPLDLPRSLIGITAHRPLVLTKHLLPNLRKGFFDPKYKNGLFRLGIEKSQFRFVDHHLSHVSVAYFSSELDDCLGISYGGFAPHLSGVNVAGAVYRCQGEQIRFLEDIPMYATGCFYSGITVALGYKYMEQEGKTMGLAALGDSTSCLEQMSQITTSFKTPRWRPYSHWIDYILSPRKDVFLETRSGRFLSNLASSHSRQNTAAAAQRLWEDNIVAFIRYQREKHGVHDLVLSGGVFLNVKLIERICSLENIKSVFVHPHTGDGSTTIGAMIEGQRQLTGESCRLQNTDMGLGLEFSDQQIERALEEAGHRITFHNISDPVLYASKQLAAGKIIGWFQGREEYGPRSLGHRCILGDPRDPAVKQRITDRIKRRESFIPLAPSCLAEYGNSYFEDFADRCFMTRTYQVKPEKSTMIPAALHVDGSARVQSVNREFYSPFRKLIEHFYIITGVPMVLNTSLNRHGDPIVHRPIEAVHLLIDSEMDELVIGPFAVRKSQFINS